MTLLNDIQNHFRRPGGELMVVSSTVVGYAVAAQPAGYPCVRFAPVPIEKWVVKLELLSELSREHGLIVYGAVNPHSGLIYYHAFAPESPQEFERILAGRLE